MSDYAIVNPDDARDAYAGTDVPGEFRRLTEALGSEQLAVTLIRVPPHSDFEQGTGHFHDEVEELYLVTRGTLTMRFGDDVPVSAPAGRPGGAGDAALAPQRGRRAGRAVGRLAEARSRRRDQDRRVLGCVAGCAAACGRLRRRGWRTRRAASSTARRSSRRGSWTPTSAAPALKGLRLIDVAIERGNLANVVAPEPMLRRVSVTGARLTGLQWTRASITDVVFRDCRIDLATFAGTTFERVTFDGCLLGQAEFREALLRSVRFDHCDLTEADLTGARIDRCELRSCALDGLAGAERLRGAAMPWGDLVGYTGLFAATLGIRVLDQDER